MIRRLLLLAICFMVVRATATAIYHEVYDYYSTVAIQFSIAEGAYHGHSLAYDQRMYRNIIDEAARIREFIPLEDWPNYPQFHSAYTRFPAQDLPGYGYLIAWTSQHFDHRLTSRYAFALQLAGELAALLIFVYCSSLAFGESVALLSGFIYLLAYPFILGLATRPIRDMFEMVVYSFYFAAFFVYARGKGVRSLAGASALVTLAAMVLWIRPSAYYFLILAAPFALFVKNRPLPSRVGFALVTVLIPLMVFGLPLRQYAIRHYGRADMHFVGARLWIGLGIIEDNPYGFITNDTAAANWVNRQGNRYKYFTPESNKVMEDYALTVIRSDPGYYLKAVALRAWAIIICPMTIPSPVAPAESEVSGLNLAEQVVRHPFAYSFDFISRTYGILFLNGGLLLALLMLRRLKHARLETLVLISPVIYSLAIQVPLYFEERYLIPAAWVLVLPLAWWLSELSGRRPAWKKHAQAAEVSSG